MGYIYKITNNINGKMYIGKTAGSLQNRWNEHKKNFKNLRDDMVIHRAMIKYGPEAFSFEQVEEVTNEVLDEREKYWIEYYDTYQNGYNSTLGGEGAQKVDYNQILKLWEESFTVSEIAEEMKIERHTVTKVLKGNHITEAEIRGRSTGAPVLQYTINGVFIKKYDSISQASRVFHSQNIGNITRCCSHKTRSAYGYLWKYENDDTPVSDLVASFKKTGKGTVKRVLQYSLNGDFIRSFDSCREAARAINAPYHVGINACCLGKQKTAYGYKWKYED